MGYMPFSSANYNITSSGQIYHYDNKKVTAGFGSIFKYGNKGLDLKAIRDRLNIKKVKVYPYDSGNPVLNQDKWTYTGADLASNKTVQYKYTA